MEDPLVPEMDTPPRMPLVVMGAHSRGDSCMSLDNLDDSIHSVDQSAFKQQWDTRAQFFFSTLGIWTADKAQKFSER